MHANLLRAVRSKGCTTLALPTLATGGQGMPPSEICLGLAEAMRADLHAHPQSLLRIRLACYERSHVKFALKAREWLREHLFQPGLPM